MSPGIRVVADDLIGVLYKMYEVQEKSPTINQQRYHTNIFHFTGYLYSGFYLFCTIIHLKTPPVYLTLFLTKMEPHPLQGKDPISLLHDTPTSASNIKECFVHSFGNNAIRK